jgi:hypothetical protein
MKTDRVTDIGPRLINNPNNLFIQKVVRRQRVRKVMTRGKYKGVHDGVRVIASPERDVFFSFVLHLLCLPHSDEILMQEDRRVACSHSMDVCGDWEKGRERRVKRS